MFDIPEEWIDITREALSRYALIYTKNVVVVVVGVVEEEEEEEKGIETLRGLTQLLFASTLAVGRLHARAGDGLYVIFSTAAGYKDRTIG